MSEASFEITLKEIQVKRIIENLRLLYLQTQHYDYYGFLGDKCLDEYELAKLERQVKFLEEKIGQEHEPIWMPVMGSPLTIEIDRNTEAIPCVKCRGYCHQVNSTKEECKKYGCGRDRPGEECCAASFICQRCGHRHAGERPAPDSDIE